MEPVINNLSEERIVLATNSILNEKLSKKYEQRIFKKKKKVGVAIFAVMGLVLISSMMFFLENDDSSKLDSKLDQQIAAIEFYSNPKFVTRGNAKEENSTNNEIITLINKGSLVEALGLFEKNELNNFPVSDLFLIAQAYQKEGRYQKSQKVIETILVNQSKLEQELNWLKALNLLKMKSYDEAKTLMESLIATQSYKWKSMQTLLKDLPT